MPKFLVPVKLMVEVEAASAAEARSLAHAVYTRLPTTYKSAEGDILGERKLGPATGQYGLPIVEVGKAKSIANSNEPIGEMKTVRRSRS